MAFEVNFGTFQNHYLDNRKICPILNKNKSKLCKVTHGLPQDSVLGPLLFPLYINDLPLASKFKSILFTDGANLHISHQNLKTAITS